MEEIARMQENLLLIRRAVGWTAEAFGEKIGVTRQTINNIESGRNKLTKTQYIAMRSVLDAEIFQKPQDTKMLRVLLDLLVDHPEKYSQKDRAVLMAKANMLVPSILAGTTSRADVSKEWMLVAKTIAGVASVLAPLSAEFVLANTWLVKSITDGKGNSKQRRG